MPVMPRSRGKATKIAWEILGKPASYNVKRTQRESEMNKRLIFEATTRVR
jgi:hypothetical protein